jgi:regulator of sirC expression with transglutaminase-like and TPR domain
VSGLTKSPRAGTPTAQSESGGAPHGAALPDASIAALVTLLERESKPDNLAIVRSRLEDLGATALPWLDAAAASAEGGRGGAASDMALTIRRRALDYEWEQWVLDPRADLETGVLLIDRFGDPCAAANSAPRILDDLAEALGRRLLGAAEMAGTIERLTAFLFSDLGFRGNTESYDDPDNSYLSRVLDRRLGIPVSLSVVVLLLASRLHLPVVGIGMPGHFLVRYGADPSGPYIDSFGSGRVLNRDECIAWLRASGFTFAPGMLQPVGPRYIVARMLRNLVAVFTKCGASSEAEILTRYLKRVIAVPETEPGLGADSRLETNPESA